MSASVNKVSLLGNLGKDPEIREIPSGKVVSFSLATSDNWTDKEENVRNALNGTGSLPTTAWESSLGLIKGP